MSPHNSEVLHHSAEATAVRTVEDRNYSPEELQQCGPGIRDKIDYMFGEQGSNWSLYGEGKEKFARHRSTELMLGNGETVRVLYAPGREHSLKNAYIPPEAHVPVPDDCRLDPNRQQPEQRSLAFKLEDWFVHRPEITAQQVKEFLGTHLKLGFEPAMSIMVNPSLLGDKHTTCALEGHERPSRADSAVEHSDGFYPGQDSLYTFLPSMCLTRQLNVNGVRHTIIGNGKWHGSSERWHGHTQGLDELPPIFDTLENERAIRNTVSLKQSDGVDLRKYYQLRNQYHLGKTSVESEAPTSTDIEKESNYEKCQAYETIINAATASKDIVKLEDFSEGTEVFIPTNLYGSPIVITGRDEFKLFEAYDKVLNQIQDADSGFVEPSIDFAATYSEETQSYTVVVYPRTNFRPENDMYQVKDKNGETKPLQIHVGFAAWEMSRVIVAITEADYALLSGELDETGEFTAQEAIKAVYSYASKPTEKTLFQLAA